MESNTSVQRPTQRKHSKAVKGLILQACEHPGASVAGIAIAHGLNPNMAQRWRRDDYPLQPTDSIGSHRGSSATWLLQARVSAPPSCWNCFDDPY
tara:strand:+ start:532 stop:816 length:285 start_codon:yes stop_codon:yes gene_type:complete